MPQVTYEYIRSQDIEYNVLFYALTRCGIQKEDKAVIFDELIKGIRSVDIHLSMSLSRSVWIVGDLGVFHIDFERGALDVYFKYDCEHKQFSIRDPNDINDADIKQFNELLISENIGITITQSLRKKILNINV